MLSAKEKRNLWLKSFEEHPELMNKQVPENIEKHRKGWCKIRVTDAKGNVVKNQKVRVNQLSHDFKFGAHIFMLDEFEKAEDNKKFREIFKEYFNLATVPFYWDGLEPEQGKPRFDKNSKKVYRRPSPELCLEYCEENGIDAKLHCLVYDKFIPSWLPKDNMAEMEKAYEERFRQIAERFAGRLYEVEVINESLQEWWWKNHSVINRKRDLNEWAFGLARKYFPLDTLVINEGGYEVYNLAERDYRAEYFMEIENALLKGAEIDKIGLQHHIFTGSSAVTAEDYERAVSRPEWVDPAAILKNLDILSEFELPLELTEVTVPTFGDTVEDEELQAELLKNLYSVWFSHPAVNTIVYWNQIEGYCYESQNREWNENRCKGGLFHHDLTPKKSALMLKKLLGEVWHTEETLETDENGYIEFRGFYGEYEAIVDGKTLSFGIHKGENNSHNLEI